jgi:uncharacterized protein (TIGR03435 family)
MKRSFAILLLLTGAAFAQSVAAPQFSAADIRPSPHSSIPAMKGPFFGDNRYEIRYATMVDLIHAAYGVDQERISGGPSWLEFDRFDVVAIAPNGSNAASRKLMLQSLLAERFGLTLHQDSKPMPAYRLIAGKNPKLQEASGSSASCDMKIENIGQPPPPSVPGEPRQPTQLPVIVFTCHGTTMASFAERLANAPTADQTFDRKPLVDQTGLEGAYDFTFRFTPQIPPGFPVTGESMPLLEALDKQLGLKAELGTAPMPVISVDRANEKPTENSPDAAKSFPPTPTEFDVAEIKPSQPGARAGQPEIKNGRVIVQGITLQNMIWLAWDKTPDDEIVGAPKWLNSDRFDLIAKAPEGVALGDLMAVNNIRRGFSINVDALRPMIRNLLVERFKMQVHTEDRPTPTWVLTAVKPKLQPADPKGRTKWTEGPAADGKDPRKSNPVLGRLVTCHNMSMAQFAALLSDIAPGYVRTGVIDATGLEGNWDFTFNFSGAGQLQKGGGRLEGDGPPGGPGGVDVASDPSGGLSLSDALAKQLGLKLETQKRPKPVLVIDHIEPKPTDN